ncbi:MAG TPA: GNAT family N-acetyltransferase [Candidatus Acidoferrales bacterium]|nr:GNAT family N-acetyltransferase [Candidatus Acidoferrales bacterium]
MQPVNPLEHADWDATLGCRPDFSFFHGLAWTRVLVETYGFRPAWQVEERSLLPLMEVDSWLTGRRGIALPFTDGCAPLCESEKEFEPLFRQALEWGRERGWRSIELRGGRELLPGAPPSIAFYRHQVDLTVGEPELFKRMDGSARQAVRKAEKEGVTVEVSASEQAVRDFYALQCLTRKRHGLPPQPRRFFLNIWRHILSQKQGMVVLASWRGRRIAGAVFFLAGGRAIYKYGASDYRRQRLRPNNLVIWEGMKWLARNGAAGLDLGKTSLLHEGLRKFKRNLGAIEHRLEYVKFDLRRKTFTVEVDDVDGWHNAIFRALPVFLSRGAGQLLYKHWA